MARPSYLNVVLGGIAAFFVAHVVVYFYTRILKLALGRFVAESTGGLRHPRHGGSSPVSRASTSGDSRRIPDY